MPFLGITLIKRQMSVLYNIYLTYFLYVQISNSSYKYTKMQNNLVRVHVLALAFLTLFRNLKRLRAPYSLVNNNTGLGEFQNTFGSVWPQFILTLHQVMTQMLLSSEVVNLSIVHNARTHDFKDSLMIHDPLFYDLTAC